MLTPLVLSKIIGKNKMKYQKPANYSAAKWINEMKEERAINIRHKTDGLRYIVQGAGFILGETAVIGALCIGAHYLSKVTMSHCATRVMFEASLFGAIYLHAWELGLAEMTENALRAIPNGVRDIIYRRKRLKNIEETLAPYGLPQNFLDTYEKTPFP